MQQAKNKQINAWARKALSLMTTHKIPVTPENYTVWYLYVSNQYGALHNKMKRMLKAGIQIDADQTHALYEKYCMDANMKAAEKFKDDLVRILRVILEEVKCVIQETDGYSNIIKHSTERLEDEHLSMEDVRILLTELLEETRKMGGLGKLVSQRLNDTTRELAVIKQNLEKARADALHDFLTGLPNRKALDTVLAEKMSEADERERPLCFLMIDIDFFKNFNDTYGHLAGDEVLKFVASSIKKLVRGSDFCARFGGEEFAVLLPHTLPAGAEAVGENIRSFFDKAVLKSKRTGKELGRITVSIGIACMKNGESADDFIERADNALYMAKNNGRNQVVAA